MKVLMLLLYSSNREWQSNTQTRSTFRSRGPVFLRRFQDRSCLEAIRIVPPAIRITNYLTQIDFTNIPIFNNLIIRILFSSNSLIPYYVTFLRCFVLLLQSCVFHDYSHEFVLPKFMVISWSISHFSRTITVHIIIIPNECENVHLYCKYWFSDSRVISHWHLGIVLERRARGLRPSAPRGGSQRTTICAKAPSNPTPLCSKRDGRTHQQLCGLRIVDTCVWILTITLRCTINSIVDGVCLQLMYGI